MELTDSKRELLVRAASRSWSNFVPINTLHHCFAFTRDEWNLLSTPSQKVAGSAANSAHCASRRRRGQPVKSWWWCHAGTGRNKALRRSSVKFFRWHSRCPSRFHTTHPRSRPIFPRIFWSKSPHLIKFEKSTPIPPSAAKKKSQPFFHFLLSISKRHLYEGRVEASVSDWLVGPVHDGRPTPPNQSLLTLGSILFLDRILHVPASSHTGQFEPHPHENHCRRGHVSKHTIHCRPTRPMSTIAAFSIHSLLNQPQPIHIA
jgi:hypothetical protein